MSRRVRRIAIIGAECVGKTELAQRLAEWLPGLWIPEYLREFCDRLRRTPRLDEQMLILAEQQAREGQAIATGLYLFAVEDRETGEVERGKFLVIKSDREGF